MEFVDAADQSDDDDDDVEPSVAKSSSSTKKQGKKQKGKKGKNKGSKTDSDGKRSNEPVNIALNDAGSKELMSNVTSTTAVVAFSADCKQASNSCPPSTVLLNPVEDAAFEGDVSPSFLGVSGKCDINRKIGQTFPPTIPIQRLFPTNDFKPGEICSHPGEHNSARMTSEECRSLERLTVDDLTDLRKAAEVHRHVRKYAQSLIHPGMPLFSFCESLENKTRELIEESGLEAGIGFPTGVSLNHCAAHFTPNRNDPDLVFTDQDIMKVDFGTQIRGRIIDCAFSVTYRHDLMDLANAVKEATNAGIAAAGIDVSLSEIGAQIQEVMESHEVVIKNKTYQVKSIRNLNGHSILPYHIHGGKSVPIIANTPSSIRMEEGEVYAIETFGSTGKGMVVEDGECSHYMMSSDDDAGLMKKRIRLASARPLFNHIARTFNTLPFCKRWFDREDGGSFAIHGNNGRQEKYALPLKHLCDMGIINTYPPLCDTRGCYTAQYEHTLILRPTCKEVLSRGDDY